MGGGGELRVQLVRDLQGDGAHGNTFYVDDTTTTRDINWTHRPFAAGRRATPAARPDGPAPYSSGGSERSSNAGARGGWRSRRRTQGFQRRMASSFAGGRSVSALS